MDELEHQPTSRRIPEQMSERQVERQRLPHAGRLRSARDFEVVRRRGRRVGGALLTLSYARQPTTEALSRVGFSVSRRVGGAVERNRVKRWLRESTRRFYSALTPGWDIMFSGRAGAADAGYTAIDAEVRALVTKARLCRSSADRGTS